MEKEIVITKITKEARKMLKILSAKEGISNQDYLSELIRKEYEKKN